MGGSEAVILRGKLALKSLDVVDETRAKWTRRKRNSQGLDLKNSQQQEDK